MKGWGCTFQLSPTKRTLLSTPNKLASVSVRLSFPLQMNPPLVSEKLCCFFSTTERAKWWHLLNDTVICNNQFTSGKSEADDKEPRNKIRTFRKKYKRVWWNCVMISFIMCNIHHITLQWLYHVERSRKRTCLHYMGNEKRILPKHHT